MEVIMRIVRKFFILAASCLMISGASGADHVTKLLIEGTFTFVTDTMSIYSAIKQEYNSYSDDTLIRELFDIASDALALPDRLYHVMRKYEVMREHPHVRLMRSLLKVVDVIVPFALGTTAFFVDCFVITNPVFWLPIVAFSSKCGLQITDFFLWNYLEDKIATLAPDAGDQVVGVGPVTRLLEKMGKLKSRVAQWFRG
jgi:hypothetical protein